MESVSCSKLRSKKTKCRVLSQELKDTNSLCSRVFQNICISGKFYTRGHP